MLTRLAAILLSTLAALSVPAVAQRQGAPKLGEGGTVNVLPEEAKGVGLDDKLGARIPSGPLMIRNHEGMPVDFTKYFRDQKPVLLSLVYYDCPLVCPLMLERLTESLAGLEGYHAGEDYRWVVVSFDPLNTDAMSKRERDLAMARYGRSLAPEHKDDIAFHTASEGNARAIADAVGYRYKQLANGEYSHPTVLVVLTPDGRVSRYLHGFDIDPRDLKLALLEATDGRIAKNFIDAFIHRCFAFDPSTGEYTMQAIFVMRVAGAITLVLVGGGIGLMVWRERRKRARARRDGQGDIATGASGLSGSMT